MKARFFLITLLAISLSVQLLRFPHLILENGGGAFLILFFVTLNFLAFPMLIIEKIIDDKLHKIDIRSLIYIKKGSFISLFDRFFVSLWFALRVLVLLCFLWFFLYIGSSALSYFNYYVSSGVAWNKAIVDIPSLPDLKYISIIALLWSALSFYFFKKNFAKFIYIFNQWLLPFVFIIVFVLFLRVMILVSHFEGLKVLFYPDFMALTPGSLLSAIGHSLACLFIGLGVYERLFKPEKDVDFIEMSLRAVILSFLVAIVVGVMSLPMIEQVSESPFGSSWLFQVLPRWLSYGSFGTYYSGLFFVCLSLLSLFITVILYSLLDVNLHLLFRLNKSMIHRQWMGWAFVACNAFMVVFLQREWQGWLGQSLLLNMEKILINAILPGFSLIMIWVVYRYTRQSERLAAFDKQQVFFHNRVFFSAWQVMTAIGVPFLILLAWIINLLL